LLGASLARSFISFAMRFCAAISREGRATEGTGTSGRDGEKKRLKGS
jgi:hypothetical protein